MLETFSNSGSYDTAAGAVTIRPMAPHVEKQPLSKFA